MFKVANEAVTSKICMTGSTDPNNGPFLELYWQYRTGIRAATCSTSTTRSVTTSPCT